MIVPSTMENINVITDNCNNQQDGQNVLSMNIIMNNESCETTPKIFQNFIIKHIDENNIELISYDDNHETANLNESTVEHSSNISEISVAAKPTEPKMFSSNSEYDLDTREKRVTSFSKSIGVPVIRNCQQGTVIQHSSRSVLKTANQPKVPSREISILAKTERVMVDVTVYSCFKCSEQFNSLTLFRQHLKWHKAAKSFYCCKCPTGFNVENNLKVHMVSHHPGDTDVCPICNIRFQRKASLKSHIMVHQVEELFLCEECHGEFQNDDELLKHMESHVVTNVTKILSDSLVCPYCKQDFETLVGYKQHIAKHVDIKRNVLKTKRARKRRVREKEIGGFKCKYCSKFFLKSCVLERHERIHTGEKPYKCQYCSRAFAQKGTLQIHLDHHTGLKPFSCTLCPAKFSQKGNLRAHVDKTHTAPKGSNRMYKCTQCACIFRKIASLNGHVTKVHLNQSEQPADSQNLIDKVMVSLRELNSELGKSALRQNELKPGTAVPPSSEATVVKVAESHASGGVRRYAVRQKKIGDVRWYFCNYCSSRFKKPSDLIRHIRTHTLEKPFKCSICNQEFSLKSTLVSHHKVHNKPSCKCNNCDSSFRNSKYYNAHVRNHERSNSPNYICLLCEKVFFTLEEAREHRLTHDGEIQSTQNIIEPLLKQPLYQTTYGTLPLKPPKPKVPNLGIESPLERPHHCKICDARFARLMGLKRHMLHHSGERKFKCNLCPKAFITKYKLKEHLNFHKNIKNFGCQICGKKFVTSSLLKRHVIIHNSVKPYLCPYCDKNFKTVLLCRSHIRNVHSVEARKEKLPVDVGRVDKSSSNKKNGDVLEINATNLPSVDNKQEALSEQVQPHGPIPPEVPQQDPVILSVPSQPEESHHELQPGYQMVYLNISDLPVTTPSGILTSDSYLFNPLNDAVLFDIDTDKQDLVDPIELIQPTTASVICNPSEVTTSLGKSADLTTSQEVKSKQLGNAVEPPESIPNVTSLVSGDALTSEQEDVTVQEFSALDLGGLPISIIDTPDSTDLSTGLVNSEIIPYDTQVICINCHKMFSDYYVFEKHACLEDSSAQAEDWEVLVEDGAGCNSKSNMLNEKVYCTSDTNITANNTGSGLEPSDNIQTGNSEKLNNTHKSDSYENRDLTTSSLPADNINIDKMKRYTYKKPLLVDVEKLEHQKPLVCQHCNFSTPFEDKFRKHLYFHPDLSDRICRFCYKEFKKPSDLKRHLRTHTGEKPFECERCHKKFALKSTLETHFRTHDVAGAKRISCDVCNSNFTSKSSLKVHMLLHSGARPYACTFCEQTFRTSTIRKTHEKNIHIGKNGQPTITKPKMGGPKLLESVAEEVTRNVRKEMKNDKKSVKTKVAKEPTETTIIVTPGQPDSMAFDPVFLLQRIQNTGIILAQGNDESLPINLGDIALLDVGDLQLSDIRRDLNTNSVNSTLLNGKKSSEATEQKQNRVECDICHKLYASKDVLRKHKKTLHGQNRKFPCIKCDKGYDQLEELNKHIAKLHTGVRPYACQYCSNSFSEENSLKTHIKRIHQKSLVGQETTNALLGLQYDLSSEDNFL